MKPQQKLKPSLSTPKLSRVPSATTQFTSNKSNTHKIQTSQGQVVISKSKAVLPTLLQSESIVFVSPQEVKKTLPRPLLKKKKFLEELSESDQSKMIEKNQSMRTLKTLQKDQSISFRIDKNYQTVPQLPLQQQQKKELSVQQQLEALGFIQWTDSEPDTEKAISVPPSAKGNPETPRIQVYQDLDITDNKDERLHFLLKMDLFEKEEMALRKQEEQIIAEVESEMYDIRKLIRIQSFMRMKRAQIHLRKIKVVQRKQGKLVTDDFKIIRLQRFIKKKLDNIRQREQTKLKVYKQKLKKYPKKEHEMICLIQNEVRRYIYSKRTQKMVTTLQSKGEKTLFLNVLQPIHLAADGKDIFLEQITANERMFRFRVVVTYPHADQIRFSLRPIDKKQKHLNYEYLSETEDLLTHLGLIDFYVGQVEQMFVENSPKLDALRGLSILSRQITHTTNQDGQIRVHFLHDKPSQLIKHLRKLCVYMKDLVRIQENKLIILGLNDFDYQSILDQEPDEAYFPPLAPVQFRSKQLNLLLNYIIQIQAFFRSTLARRRYLLLKQKGRKVVQQFVLPAQERSDYLTLVKILDRRTHFQFYYVIRNVEKKRTNEIEHHPPVFRHLGHLRVENFFDVFQLDLKNNRLDYSEEGKYWIDKANEDLKRSNQNITTQKLNESAIIIQRNIRSYLFKRRAEICLENLKRNSTGNNSIKRHQIIVKRAMIYQEGQSLKAYLTSFVLTTETVESTKNQMLESQKKLRGVIEQQSITIQTKALEHLYSKDKVMPFTQKLFYYVDLSEMITIANRMVEMSRIIKGKQNVLKVDVKPLEDVQGILMNEQRERTGAQHVVKKDETLSSRVKFSRQELIIGFFSKNSTNMQSVTDTQQFRSKLILIDQEEGQESDEHDKYMEKYVRVIQRKFKAYLIQCYEKIRNKKHLGSDGEAVKNFVDNFNPTTNLGMPNETEQEEDEQLMGSDDSEVEIESEEEKPIVYQKQPSLEHRKSFLNITDKIHEGIETLSGHQCSLVLTFNPKLMQVVAIATLLESGHPTERSKANSQKHENTPPKQSKTVIPKAQLLGGSEPNLAYFQTKIIGFIISQLHLDEEVLFFKPNPKLQSDFLKGQIEFEKAEAQKKKLKQETATLNFDLNKRTLQTLEDSGKNVIELATIDKNGFQLEFLFDITDHQCLITLYNIEDNKIRKIIKFGMTEFNCSYIDVELPQKSKDEIIRFFYSTVKMIQVHLQFEIVVRNDKKSIITNWPQVKPKLSQIMREKFVQRIQGMLQIRKLTQKFKLYKQSKQNQIFLQRFVDLRDSRYVESRFFLIKNKGLLKVMVKELTTMDGGGNMVEHLKKPLDGDVNRRLQLRTRVFQVDLMLIKDQYEIYNVIENLKKAEQIICQRMSYNQLADLTRTKTIEYYRCLFGPLIQVIHKNLRVRYLGQNMNINLLNINLPFDEIKYVPKRKKQNTIDDGLHLFYTIKAASRLQQVYRRSKEQDWYKQKSQRIKELKVRRKNLGSFVKRVFKKIGRDYYVVNIYSKSHKRAEHLVFTYELIPYQYARVKQDKQKMIEEQSKMMIRRNQIKRLNSKQQLMRGTFMWNPSLLLNTGSVPLYEYILQLLYIEGGMVKFQEKDFNYHNPQEMIDPVSQTIVEDKKQELVPQDINEQLVHHHEIEIEGKRTIYDVVYTGQSKIRDKNHSTQQLEEATQVKDNTVKIEVNLSNVKKLYPSLNNRKTDIMKIIGENLADGIKVDHGGRLLVNSKKISSQFLSVLENNLKKEQEEPTNNFQINLSQSQAQPPIRRLRPSTEKPSKRQVLVKCTTVYCKMKFLIIVYHVERRIQRIMKASKDEVFESYEQVYQIQASNIDIKKEDLKASDLITWELTPEEAQILSQRSVRQEIAQVLSKRLQVLNGKLIYLCFSEKDILAVNIVNPSVILFVEKTISPIQKRFKNRSFVQNYKMYKERKKDFFNKKTGALAENVALFEVNNLKDLKKMFIVVCYEDSNRAVFVTAWDVETFIRYEKEIPKNKYIQNYTEAKYECMRALVNFVEFYHDKVKANAELIFSNPKQEFFAEYFEEEKRKSQSQLTQSQMRMNESQKLGGSQHNQHMLVQEEGTQQTLNVPIQVQLQASQESEGSQVKSFKRSSQILTKNKLEIDIPVSKVDIRLVQQLPENPMVSQVQSRRSSHALAQPTIIQ